MRALDLSRPPTEKELRRAGQLGGPLHPIGNADVDKLTAQLNRELQQLGIAAGLLGSAPPNTPAGRVLVAARAKQKRLKDINLSFGQAIQEWNQHKFRDAAKKFEKHLKEFPDSPWAGEAQLHLGCDAKYNGRFSEAQERYDALLQSTKDDPKDPSYEIHQKAKLRWADLDIALGQLDNAAAKLQDILKTDSDWRRKTWAMHWLRNVGMYKANERDLRACGSQALSVVLASLGKKQAAEKIARLHAPREAGFSLAELARLAAQQGVALKGFKARPEQLMQLPLPLIIHYDFHELRHAASVAASARQRHPAFRLRPGPGHFLVVRGVDAAAGLVKLYDPLAQRPYTLDYAELAREWSGLGLAVAPGSAAGKTRFAALEIIDV